VICSHLHGNKTDSSARKFLIELL